MKISNFAQTDGSDLSALLIWLSKALRNIGKRFPLSKRNGQLQKAAFIREGRVLNY